MRFVIDIINKHAGQGINFFALRNHSVDNHQGIQCNLLAMA